MFCRIVVGSPVPPQVGGGGGVEKGCVTFEFPGRFYRLFIIPLASEERIPKQLTQVSIVGRMECLLFLKAKTEEKLTRSKPI